ncbi:hypothetical protein EAI_01837 [Harpegnathos saltator]|uniref:Uncharacterized protein n=1 Tax=Harpegnathos saltator TaxID=610380 RepID=E2B7D2_HARSA|nr:hypothetical protein EAI_01837 [Harpegnathos saltator]
MDFMPRLSSTVHHFESHSARTTRAQAPRMKSQHQDGGSVDDRRGQTMPLVRVATNQGRTKVGTTPSTTLERRMLRNHELKYPALYPRQSPVDPCAIRSSHGVVVRSV